MWQYLTQHWYLRLPWKYFTEEEGNNKMHRRERFHHVSPEWEVKEEAEQFEKLCFSNYPWRGYINCTTLEWCWKGRLVFEVRVGFWGMRVSQGVPVLFLPSLVSWVYISVYAVSEYFLSHSIDLLSRYICMYCLSDVFIHTVWSASFLWTFPEDIWNLPAVLKKTVLQSVIC